MVLNKVVSEKFFVVISQGERFPILSMLISIITLVLSSTSICGAELNKMNLT
jgi:hypothetical protein